MHFLFEIHTIDRLLNECKIYAPAWECFLPLTGHKGFSWQYGFHDSQDSAHLLLRAFRGWFGWTRRCEARPSSQIL